MWRERRAFGRRLSGTTRASVCSRYLVGSAVGGVTNGRCFAAWPSSAWRGRSAARWTKSGSCSTDLATMFRHRSDGGSWLSRGSGRSRRRLRVLRRCVRFLEKAFAATASRLTPAYLPSRPVEKKTFNARWKASFEHDIGVIAHELS